LDCRKLNSSGSLFPFIAAGVHFTAAPVHLTAAADHLIAAPEQMTVAADPLIAAPVYLTAARVQFIAAVIQFIVAALHLTAAPVYFISATAHLTAAAIHRLCTKSPSCTKSKSLGFYRPFHVNATKRKDAKVQRHEEEKSIRRLPPAQIISEERSYDQAADEIKGHEDCEGIWRLSPRLAADPPVKASF